MVELVQWNIVRTSQVKSCTVMSKDDTPKLESQINTSFQDGARLVTNNHLSNLEGRLLTLIETLGFSEPREQAVKGIVRQHIWDLVPYWDENWVVGEKAINLVRASRNVPEGI